MSMKHSNISFNLTNYLIFSFLYNYRKMDFKQKGLDILITISKKLCITLTD